ncbi:MAG: flagellar basal body-associated protein FliL [Verrucomicrobiae bacterium]|nr:flagellar basal body-associated protein FliL [Verrucomicrobiae bacterium]
MKNIELLAFVNADEPARVAAGTTRPHLTRAAGDKIRKTKAALLLCGLLALAMPAASIAGPGAEPSAALTNAVILVIRHAEKPASGHDLSPAGKVRATAYVNYFKNFTVAGQPLKLDYIFATADSKGSHRPRLTVEPTGKAFGLAVDSRFSDKDFQAQAEEIRSKPHGRAILIAWHHGQIPALLRALGADPDKVIPNAKWPDDVFGWVIQLRFDADGRLVETKRINEHLMPDDLDQPAEK